MEAPMTISRVAARTGFTTSALRFYEDAGLVRPARTGAGYRIYDERTVERLRFLARAKQLGLALDEITELMTLWDGEECRPVATHLRGLVDTKIDETERRIVELTAFADDLRRFRGALRPEMAEGCCGDSCACHGSAPVALTTRRPA